LIRNFVLEGETMKRTLKVFVLASCLLVGLIIFSAGTAQAQYYGGYGYGGMRSYGGGNGYNSWSGGYGSSYGYGYNSHSGYGGGFGGYGSGYHPPSVHYHQVYHPTSAHWTPDIGYHTHGHYHYLPHHVPGHYHSGYGNNYYQH
jgi:hypothetical protein